MKPQYQSKNGGRKKKRIQGTSFVILRDVVMS